MNSFEVFPWSAYVFGARAVEEARANPGLRHYEGPGANKPWHRGCRASHREAYFEHRLRTPWPDVQMVGSDPEASGPLRRIARVARRRLSA
jgi:hypothetical protein